MFDLKFQVIVPHQGKPGQVLTRKEHGVGPEAEAILVHSLLAVLVFFSLLSYTILIHYLPRHNS